MALLSLIVLVVCWLGGSSANDVEENAFCPLTALVPQQQKPLAYSICKLEDSIIVIEHILQELMSRTDITLGTTATDDNDHSMEKRKNEFIRFGKRKNEFIR
ncbi:hypothetical protein Tcan_15961 [Toxocara canis]|uniref:Uncharacterized protein n=1 Tax=Toxocara canis TaxID=6265 RepID=A0A0B2URJ1_TOXCA|nr:hypothetical protein Tcan_15961 [Toxocara canis]